MKMEVKEKDILENFFKSLDSNKNDEVKSKEIILNINSYLTENKVDYNKFTSEMLYLYMFLCNKYEITEYLDELLEDKIFIKALDSSNISGSTILMITSNCKKPRYVLLSNSNKIRNSILKGDELFTIEEILANLNKEEILILRNDVDIDNYLLTKGLGFNALKEETINRLLTEVTAFSLYDFKTINEFTNNFQDIKYLASNEEFLNIYLNKLPNDYSYENKIFNYLNKKSINSILKNNDNEVIILHLLKDTIGDVKNTILKYKGLNKIIENNMNEYVINSLPITYLLNLIEKSKDVFNEYYVPFLDTLDKKVITNIAKNNKYYYSSLLEQLNNLDNHNISVFIKSLPLVNRKDLCERIKEYNLETINILLKADNKLFKKVILDDKSLCTRILSKINKNNYHLLNEMFNNGKFTSLEKEKFICNCNDIDKNTLKLLIADIPQSNRKFLYDNPDLRNKLLNESDFILDEYAINYYLNNIDDIYNTNSNVIATILIYSDMDFANKLLEDKRIITKLYDDIDNNILYITKIMKSKNILIPKFRDKEFYKYFNCQNIQNILNNLDYQEKELFCTSDLIKYILNNDEYFTMYKRLLNQNEYLLNTIDFRIFNDDILDLKLSILDKITKSRDIQESIIIIRNNIKLSSELINNIIYILEDTKMIVIFKDILNILKNACLSKNIKSVGNLNKIFKNVDLNKISRGDLNEIISYFLYLIPRYYDKNELVLRPIVLGTPNTYNEIISYERNIENKLTELISTCPLNKLKDYFIQKHFKLSIKEAFIMLKIYSIEKIDSKIYSKEYKFLTNLNRIVNTSNEELRLLDLDYPVISILESFIIEENIRKMYGKIYNYELKTKNLKNSYIMKSIYGREIKIYKCPLDFILLVSNMDISNYLSKTSSYLTSWHYTLNNSHNGLNASLIANDNLVFNDDILFGFDGILDDGIEKMSYSKIEPDNYNSLINKYVTPRQLIDNTRDLNNTIVINRYALRTNYNNGNIPNIEPDFILVDFNKLDDNNYLEKIERASLEFKSKRNKNGLPIIAIDKEKIANNELSKIKELIDKYKKGYDMNLLNKILTKIENNYTAYYNSESDEVKKFDICLLTDIINKRVRESNSIKELDYILDLFKNEYNKYKVIDKSYLVNFDIVSLEKLITERKSMINNN